MATQESLWQIHQVQVLDAKLALLERTRAGLDDGSALGRDAAQRQANLTALQEEAHRAEAAVKQAELELASVEERAKRIHGVLYSGKVGNPKELQGYEGDLASLGRRKDALEDQVLSRMEERDASRERVAAAEAVLHKAKVRWKKHVIAYREQVAALDAEKAELQGKRDALRALADTALLRAYDIAARSRKPLVGLVDDNTCTGCGIRLHARLMREYQLDSTIERDCPSCGAHLLWKVPASQ